MRAAWGAILVALCVTLLAGTPMTNAAATTPTWTPIQAPGPVADSTGYHLNAVDCWAAGNCVAVGYRSAGGTSGSFIDQETNGKWSYVDSTTSQGDLTAVSCPAAGACVAVGTFGPTSQLEGYLAVQSGSTWTDIIATGAQGRYSSYTGSVTGISCPATGSCAAVGQAQSSAEVSTGFTLTLEPSSDRTVAASWTAQKAPESAAEVMFESAGLAGVSCVDSGDCTAVGVAHNDSNFSDGLPLIDVEKNYVWSYGGAPTTSGTQYAQLAAISCVPGGTVCMAAGTESQNELPYVVTIDTSNGSSEAAGNELPSGFKFGELSATSCARDGLCQAVGQTYANDGSDYGYNGLIVSDKYGAGAGASTSSAAESPVDANTIEHNETLESTSCVSGGICVSVGDYLDTSGPQGQDQASVIDTRAYDSSGAVTDETDIKAPEPANDVVSTDGTDDDQNTLLGVNCDDGTHCVAVGSYFNDDATRARGVIDTLGSTPVTPPKKVPAVTKVSASKGPAAGGNSLTVTGSNLSGATAVKFGSTTGTHLHVVSSTRLTVRAPKHAAGRVDVRVTTGGGTSAVAKADRYTFVAAPQLTEVSPASGSHRGGETINISGKNLNGATVVRFGGTKGTHLVVASSTKLVVTAPAHSRGTVDVQVTTTGGTSATHRADRFQYT